MKKEIKNVIKNLLLHIFNNENTDDKYKALLKEERYKPVELKLLGYKFIVADALSFYYNHKEIFIDKIYFFKSKNHQPIIIDCGANYGTSIMYFKSLYPEARIIAFEADPYIYKILQSNINEATLENVTLYNNAVWYEETFVSFLTEGADSGKVKIDSLSDREFGLKVKTKVLSSFLSGQKVDFLKIDIEGAEIEVLKECQHYLSNVENIFVEYHSFLDKEQQLDEILLILKNAGFRFQIQHQLISKSPLVKVNTYNGMDLQLNIFGYRHNVIN